MSVKNFPLKEMSINEVYKSSLKAYEIPIYQRNYAWEYIEIKTLVQDVYDSFKKDKNSIYYIGTLVTFNKGDNVFEIIDGQQRLTTIYLVLTALDKLINPNEQSSIISKLKFHARKKSDDTIKSLPECNVEEIDSGISNGYHFAKKAIEDNISSNELTEYRQYFFDKVHIIHYQVPKDINLNHYFEVMNSRGEQLEKHEIVKAKLYSCLNEEEQFAFSKIWDSCSEMGRYIQQVLPGEYDAFDKQYRLVVTDFNEVAAKINSVESENKEDKCSITSFLDNASEILNQENGKDKEKELEDKYQPIIDFSNFLLIILKLTLLSMDKSFDCDSFKLDDKELLLQFEYALEHFRECKADFVRVFIFNLLKGKYLLDNYFVHHIEGEEKAENNPWKLMFWRKNKDTGKESPHNLFADSDSDEQDKQQDMMVSLLSLFEVTYTARQRKNYLLYCLLYLFKNSEDLQEYAKFTERLAEKYFRDIYLVRENLNEKNTPIPGAFDSVILKKLKQGDYTLEVVNHCDTVMRFNEIYGTGKEPSKGIPLFVFNYLDYKIWKEYLSELAGKKTTPKSPVREKFFKKVGCEDFGLEFFKYFYFSRTRRSLEHYYAQSLVNKEPGYLSEEQINCFGNYAMIGSAANSSGSNFSPKTKALHYQDNKVDPVSVASLKFKIMLQRCIDNNGEWDFDEIREHQENMVRFFDSNVELERKSNESE